MNKISTSKGMSFNTLVVKLLNKLFERPDVYSLKYYHRKKRSEDSLRSL